MLPEDPESAILKRINPTRRQPDARQPDAPAADAPPAERAGSPQRRPADNEPPVLAPTRREMHRPRRRHGQTIWTVRGVQASGARLYTGFLSEAV